MSNRTRITSNRDKTFRPYIRRANGKETADSWRDAIRLAFFRQQKRTFYVLVQHGFRRAVMACAGSRADLISMLPIVASGRKTFRKWSRGIQKHAK